MSKKMLIDASHSEETRVAIVEGNRVEEFDFESAAKKPIRGNIYLAKVTRVEPSLQAAFVDYGGNRHGFLAFNEIHPDYYQIPQEDRLELQAEEEKAVEQALAEAEEAEGDEDGENGEDDTDAEVEAVARKRRQFFRKYKIQEVIKRRQILLVQVAKEERGNKGAALTTYLSLAGRYCVLMPNTPRGGGISRKISNGKDRKRLKEIVSGLELPTGMGLIVRTAGATRTKAEIRRDHDYLRRVWEDIRDKTLESMAPSLVYEEGDLVRRAIRDMYDREVEMVMVEGEAGYKEAKGFMKLLMPSHASKVQHYKEPMPLFVRHHVEDQLEEAFNEQTQLKSGGYLVIHQTEALVAIDVNSGRSTRERNIEDTALKTNLEAADEAARQMRLRDLAGLVVIDFIDMEENRNVRAVEKRMKDALKKDRARLQMGRISQFGLMELSRQRRRTSILEGSTKVCPHCGGKGYVRTSSSSALVALRALEEEGARNRARRIRINVPTDVALYLLNEKREHVLSIEQRYDMRIMIAADPDLLPPDFKVDILSGKSGGDDAEAPADKAEALAPSEETSDQGSNNRRRRRRRRRKDEDSSSDVEADTAEEGEDSSEAKSGDDDEEAPRKRRRRGRRGGRGRRRNRNPEGAETSPEEGEAAEAAEPAAMAVIDPEAEAEAQSDDKPDGEEEKPKRRRRRKIAEPETADEAPASEEATEEKPKRRTRRKKAEEAAAEDTPPADDSTEEKPKRRRTRKKPEAAPEDSPEAAEAPAEPAEKAAEKPKRRTRKKKSEEAAPAADEAATPSETAQASEPSDDDKPKKTGWWQRGSKLFGGGE